MSFWKRLFGGGQSDRRPIQAQQKTAAPASAPKPVQELSLPLLKTKRTSDWALRRPSENPPAPVPPPETKIDWDLNVLADIIEDYRPPQLPQSKSALDLPPQFDGKTSFRDMFRTLPPEQLRAMCAALPVEQLDLKRPGQPPMLRAISQVFAVAAYMATKEVPAEYGDLLFPRLVAKIAGYKGSDLHLAVCDSIRDFAINLEAGGRHLQAIQVLRVLGDSFKYSFGWPQCDIYLFNALNNLALETKQQSDFQAALEFAQKLPGSKTQELADSIKNLKEKIEASEPAPMREPPGDPMDTNCRKCHKPLGPGGRRGTAVMSGSDLMSLMADRAVYACKSCGTPFCMDCMAELKANPCPACNKALGW